MSISHPLEPGTRVIHDRFGNGSVVVDGGVTVVVRFDHGIEECERDSVRRVASPSEVAGRESWDSPAELIAKVLAEAIRSVNDTWGVFSRSQIALLPHQLWVCRRVLEQWPTRWLVADDVGLGKTIEAGLVLWPLLSKRSVQRLLILCPASLVEQWAERLRRMFDIRLSVYSPEVDTARADFWGTHNTVVASLETIRADNSGRHARMFDSPPWDLLIVDEAHRLNYDEQAGPTLGYKLVDRLVRENRVASVLFFTGTPHRGKDFGFLSLLKLLRPDRFDPKQSVASQLQELPSVLIRNNKQNVTDLKGTRLFHAPSVSSETYAYSDVEAAFYDKLTLFISTGQAYASRLRSSDARAVMLVLIAMQKLASSSVAAIRRALRNRLGRIESSRTRVDELAKTRQRLEQYERTESADPAGDELAKLDVQIAEATIELHLMEDEEDRLRELIAAADAVQRETKIERILELVDGPFQDRQVLFFTEYKATQSLLMSRLIAKYGNECVAFINGDERAEEVVDASGRVRTLAERRESAADRFNAGEVRFLVSTEAGGEGIDLQERCHSLVHVDLPWNPMRLHQRVGRLNRYGQARQVEVITLRNPATVESRIWDKLNAKILSIQSALGAAMDQPEDLMQLVLGMTSPSLFRELFAEADRIPRDSLDGWFDRKTATFGGRDVLDTVRDLVGHAAKFDFQQVTDQLPRLDLPALKPFLVLMLLLNRRRVRDEGGSLSFKTPEAWADEIGILSEYDGLVFDRQRRGRDASTKVVGVGHKVFDRAMRAALLFEAVVTPLPKELLPHPLFVFRIVDRVTGGGSNARSVIAGVARTETGFQLLRDFELIERLNPLCVERVAKIEKAPPAVADRNDVTAITVAAEQFLQQQLPVLQLAFRVPMIQSLGLLWPEASEQQRRRRP